MLQAFEHVRANPFLKWAGGKTQLLRELENWVPRRFGTYFEPFLGGGALFFHLYGAGKIRRAILSDLNWELINAFLVIRDQFDLLVQNLSELQKHARSKSYYYEVARRRYNAEKINHVEKAALLFYLNRTCYNGLYRVNKNGKFNVPWGGYKNPKLFDKRKLQAVNMVLDDPEIQVKWSDFSSVEDAQKGDLVYFDPPYQPLSATASFTEYTSVSFRIEDQRRLANIFHKLSSRGCRLMLSNSPRVESLYTGRGYRVEKIKAARAINSIGAGRGGVDELMIMNY